RRMMPFRKVSPRELETIDRKMHELAREEAHNFQAMYKQEYEDKYHKIEQYGIDREIEWDKLVEEYNATEDVDQLKAIVQRMIGFVESYKLPK
ncbi:MAG: hypothetical protein ACREHG_07570, partial [Candidatus Saccharimonadales bacterium]